MIAAPASPAAAQRRLAWAVIAVAAAVLAGWGSGVPALVALVPHAATTKANAALGLLCGGAALLAIDRRGAAAGVFAAAAAVATALLGAATLLEDALGVPVGIDRLLLRDTLTPPPGLPDRMSPLTAVALLGSGIALLPLAVSRHRRAVSLAHAAASVPAAVGLLSVTGYAYGVERLGLSGPHVAVALPTGIGLSLLAAAILTVRRREGWAAGFAELPIAGGVVRRIGTLTVMVPFVAGLAVVWGVRLDAWQTQFTPALLVVASIAALAFVLLRSARILGVAEAGLREARAMARRESEALERTRRRHVAMIEGLPQLVWTCRPDGECDYMSPQWLAYAGGTEAALLGRGWLDQLHPDDRDRTATHWAGAVAGDHGYDIEYRLRGAAGGHRWFKSRGAPVRGPDGAIAYWFGTCTDIEDIVAAREVLARSRRDLEAAVEARTRALMEVEAQLRQSQKMEAVGQLTGGLAHDFNNLLTGISGNLELIQSRLARGRPEGINRFVEAAQGSAGRAAALTHRLLAFSRRQTLDPRPTDVAGLVSGMRELIERTMGPAIAVEVSMAAGLWSTLVDPSQLENALLNLCINARDAMPDGGRLSIEGGNERLDEAAARARELPPGRYCSLCVRDDGAGMTAEVAARAFDPFFTTKPIGQGTGLGLSMIYGFARQSGGQVRIRSEPGRGTTVCLSLPRHDGGDPDPPPPAPEAAAPRGAGRGETVLVVDDEPTVRRLVTEVLEGHGYAVIEAEDGASGLAALDAGARIDLLVTDVGLPGGLNGRQLADAARVRRAGLRVLFITGYAENAVLGHGQLEPGMHVLTKPFALDDLARRVRGLID